jgi:serine/threonine protein kinase/Flp pilus assembly protein TadD
MRRIRRNDLNCKATAEKWRVFRECWPFTSGSLSESYALDFPEDGVKYTSSANLPNRAFWWLPAPDIRCFSDEVKMNTAADKLQAIDDAIEHFEQKWRPDMADLIQQVAESSGLPGDSQLLVELIRVDIDRRYAAGRDVDLQGYFSTFPDLLLDSSHVEAICFEDYRVRKQRRKACPLIRWAGFRGVESATWFRELQSETQLATGSGHVEFPSTASFISSHLMPGENSFAPAATPHPSERIGDFELVALLGEGAFSRVYLARQTSLGRRYVAAKVVDRPMQEPYNLSRLQHTGIVPLYSCHEAEGRWVLCMPYSGATTLARWLREFKNPQHRTGASLRGSVEAAQARLTSHDASLPVGLNNPTADVVQSLRRWHQAASGPLQQLQNMNSGRLALWIFRRLASALAHAHQRGLVHGDLKPANILIRNDGEPALIDFNLSQSTESRQRAWVGGTMPYLAREQLQQLLTHSAGPPRPEYDIHALGVIMFEILEGRLPFRPAANTSAEELQAALASHRQLPEFKANSGSPGLRTIVSACLAPGTAGSYPTAVELLADIDREIANQSLRHARESFWKGRLPKILRRYPRAFSGGFITAVACMVIGLLGLWLASARQSQQLLFATTARDKLMATSEETCSALFYAGMENNSSSTPSSDDVLRSMLEAVGCEPGELFADKWGEIAPRLTAEELSEARCSMTFLAIVAAHARLQEQRSGLLPASAGKPLEPNTAISNAQVRSILSVLPQNLRTGSWSACLLDAKQEPAGDDGTALIALSGLPETTSIQGLDDLLSAVRLANFGKDAESLRMLEKTAPPRCLKTFHWLFRGHLHHRLGQFREAAAAFSVILNELPSLEPALLCRGVSLLAQGRYAEADLDFTAALEENPRLTEAWLQRNFARQQEGRFDAALADVSEAIQLQPNSVRCYVIRARIYEKLNKPELAEADFNQARRLPATSLEDSVARASAWIAVDPKVALEELQSAEERFGPRTRTLQTMVRVLSEQLHRETDALGVLDRLLRVYPTFQKALTGRAVLHARLGNAEQSLADIEAVVRTRQPIPGELMFQVASAYSLCSKDRPELRQQALHWLVRAIASGYGAAKLDTDPDLAPLREDPEFAVIRRTAWLLQGKRIPSD